MKKTKDLITQICEIAKDVYSSLGSGHTECVYGKAMEVGLRQRGIRYEGQRVVELIYLDHFVGEGYADHVARLNTEVIVAELKVIAKLGPGEEQQLLNYLKILGIQRGLLINYPKPGSGTTEPEFKGVSSAQSA
jgi:GxxExxY protein